MEQEDKNLFKQDLVKGVKPTSPVKAIEEKDEIGEEFKKIADIIEKKVEKNIIFRKIEQLETIIKGMFEKKDPQKIEGKVIVDFPAVQKVSGEVRGVVRVENLKEVQKIDDANINKGIEGVRLAIEKIKIPQPATKVEISNLPKEKDSIKVSELPEEQFNKIEEAITKSKFSIAEIVSFFAKNPDAFLNVRLTDGKMWYNALKEMMASAGGGANIKASAVDIINVSMPASGTEYSYQLPNKVEKILIKSRNLTSALQVSFNQNESGTKYMTIPVGSPGMSIDLVHLNGRTLYFQSPDAGQTAEIMIWLSQI